MKRHKRIPEVIYPRHDSLNPESKIRMPERFEDKPSPLSVARHYLAGRMGEIPGAYTLDGVPVTLTTIIRETNRIIKQDGGVVITGDPSWAQ